MEKKVNTEFLGQNMPLVRILYSRQFDNGRSFALSSLIEPIEGHEEETHALSIETPIQRNVYLLNASDAPFLAVLAQVLNGGKPISPRWIDREIQKKVSFQQRIKGDI